MVRMPPESTILVYSCCTRLWPLSSSVRIEVCCLIHFEFHLHIICQYIRHLGCQVIVLIRVCFDIKQAPGDPHCGGSGPVLPGPWLRYARLFVVVRSCAI